jgi:hypothetical protein
MFLAIEVNLVGLADTSTVFKDNNEEVHMDQKGSVGLIFHISLSKRFL